MNIDFIISLLREAENFENSVTNRGNLNIEDFRLWLNDQYYRSQSPRFISEEEKKSVNDLENEIAKQVILLGRFTKQMVRRGLTDFPELCNEEFTYLYRLMDEPMLTKMQLIEKNAHEKQTGTEIIKRLVKYGLVEELSDPQDRRLKRLKLTDAGRDMFSNSVQDVSTTSRVLSAKLDNEEKLQLLNILKKLNEFHFNVYFEHKDSNIEEINAMI